MTPIDWILLSISIVFVIACAAYTRRYVKSVADFMAGGRAAGRYLICNAKGEAGSGVANSLSRFQVILLSGLVVSWWDSVQMAVYLLVGMSGFVVYRFRQTRAMTIGQFFEMRYSRSFRLFAGALGVLAGVLNYGIFPAVSSKFFVAFLQLPEKFHGIPTQILIMAVYLACTQGMMLVGGQVTLIVTDCVQGIFSHVVYAALAVVIFTTVSWSQMQGALSNTAPRHSMLNPFDAQDVKDFNMWYSLMTTALYVYANIAWQNGNNFNASARNPHEARMGNMLGFWRLYARQVMIVVLALASLAFLHDKAFTIASAPANEAIKSIADAQERSQMTVPIALRYMLPAGLKGLFCTMMVMGLIAGDASHLMTWGGIFIQDIVLPLRKNPLSPAQHLKILRLSVAGVAVFAFFFSILFRQTQAITLWWAVTMAVITAGGGIAILGGLYWSWGTTAGAWSATITGASLAFAGIMIPHFMSHPSDFPLNGTQTSMIAACVSIVVYIAVSLATYREPFNMDWLLRRGQYAVEGETPVGRRNISSLLGFNSDFTRLDRIVAGGVVVWSFFWLLVVLVGTIWNLVHPWPQQTWAHYWFIVGIILPMAICMITMVWFSIGGFIDLRDFFKRLATLRRDANDDGTVTEPKPDSAPTGAIPVAATSEPMRVEEVDTK